MTKQRILSIFGIFIILSILALSVVSASHDSYSNRASAFLPSSSSGSSFKYSESPGFTQFPTETSKQNTNFRTENTNFDSSSYSYDYRGPMFERKSVYEDDFLRDNSAKSGFFYSKNKNILKHKITNTVTEKYVGASESVYSNSQNNRVSLTTANTNADKNYNGGFSFGKQRLYDASEYQKEGYTTAYYYRPSYNSNSGYYNWKY